MKNISCHQTIAHFFKQRISLKIFACPYYALTIVSSSCPQNSPTSFGLLVLKISGIIALTPNVLAKKLAVDEYNKNVLQNRPFRAYGDLFMFYLGSFKLVSNSGKQKTHAQVSPRYLSEPAGNRENRDPKSAIPHQRNKVPK